MVRRVSGLTPEYQIEVSDVDGQSAMTIRVEADKPGATEAERAALGDQVSHDMRAAIRVSSSIEVLPAGTLPRSDGRSKLARVIDRRTRAQK